MIRRPPRSTLFPTRRSSDLIGQCFDDEALGSRIHGWHQQLCRACRATAGSLSIGRSEEHTSELQSRLHLVCRLLLEKKKNHTLTTSPCRSVHQPYCAADS